MERARRLADKLAMITDRDEIYAILSADSEDTLRAYTRPNDIERRDINGLIENVEAMDHGEST